ncbi:MAG: glycosyltransferase [Deltaproteobacteria bacterium]|nr:glycosyltransferase [Deltaproteobacteria bacterium]
MKISVITAVLNSQKTIRDAIESVLNQDYKNVEHIIIDGGSTDGTLEVIEEYRGQIARMISEPDWGVYEALNKGIRLSTGKVIGILHGDDFYAHSRVLRRVVEGFEKQNRDSCYGDLQYVDKKDVHKVLRHWKSAPYTQGKFKSGWMPPHPTFFVKRRIYEKYGLFNEKFRIAGDYELMLRFLERYRISTFYIPEVLVKMRWGGISNGSVKNLFIKSYEDYKAWEINHLKGNLLIIFLKNLSKVPQLLRRA